MWTGSLVGNCRAPLANFRFVLSPTQEPVHRLLQLNNSLRWTLLLGVPFSRVDACFMFLVNFWNFKNHRKCLEDSSMPPLKRVHYRTTTLHRNMIKTYQALRFGGVWGCDSHILLLYLGDQARVRETGNSFLDSRHQVLLCRRSAGHFDREFTEYKRWRNSDDGRFC